MKTQNIIFSFVILLLISGCEIADETEDSVKKIAIVTNKNLYDVGEFINISIENQLSDTARHYKCDNHDLRLSHLIKKESDTWIAAEFPLWCTAMGPSGYIGSIFCCLQTKFY